MTEEQVVYSSPVSVPLPHLPIYYNGHGGVELQRWKDGATGDRAQWVTVHGMECRE
jgi:hypothetical protein